MKSFNNLPITAKLGILVGVTLLGLCAAGVMAARLVSQEMMSARMEQTHAIVDVALNMAKGLQKQVEAGEPFLGWTLGRAHVSGCWRFRA